MKRLGIATVIFVLIVGIAYLSTVSCCQWFWPGRKTNSLMGQLQLTAAQRQAILPLEKNFMAQKEAACQTLCGKRAQLIQILRQSEPDQKMMAHLVEEIGQEQTLFEKATMDHLMVLRQHLSPSQQEKLTGLVTEELRSACKATACGVTPGCVVTRIGNQRTENRQ